MENYVYTIAVNDGSQWVFVDHPDEHEHLMGLIYNLPFYQTNYIAALDDFNQAVGYLREEKLNYNVAIIRYNNLEALKQNHDGTTIKQLLL